MNSAVAVASAGFVGRPASRRVIPRNARIIGRAAGSIIATIITTMRAKKTPTPETPVGTPIARNDIAKSDVDQVTYEAAATRTTTRPAMGTVIRRRRAGGDIYPS